MTATPGERRQRGQWAEQKVCDHLERLGLRLLSRNYRSPFGEIDLVMRDRDCLVFVEVRFRRSSRFGSAPETVDARKQSRLRATAEHYLQRNRRAQRLPCRFDVVGVTTTQGQAEIDWIRDAF